MFLVHGDIKPSNILLFSPEFKAKLSGFDFHKTSPVWDTYIEKVSRKSGDTFDLMGIEVVVCQ